MLYFMGKGSDLYRGIKMLRTEKAFRAIESRIENEPGNFRLYEALYALCREEPAEDSGYKWELTARLKEICAKNARKDVPCQYNLLEMVKELLLMEARGLRFDSYMQYIELNRPPERRFWLPRREQLLPVCNLIQDLIDDKLDILTISLPPRVGKTTLEVFLLTMIMGAYPDDCSFVASYSGPMAASIYKGVCDIITDTETYLWGEVFPASKVFTHVKNGTIDLNKNHRFSTLTCKGIDQSITGMVKCNRLLCCDDLVQNLEEAVSAPRMEKLWQTYTTDLRQRKENTRDGRCKELHLATRWSVHDPIGRIQAHYANDPRVKCYAFPATDENGKSNFMYRYNCGFDDKYYADLQSTMEDANYRALYMNEPIEREGLLYPEGELRRYFELPGEDKTPDAVIAVCDTKDKGTDYCVLIIGFIYGENIFIEDVICNNALPEIVEPNIVRLLLKYNVQMAQIESNNAGGRIAQSIAATIKKAGGITKIDTKFSTANKETKILVNSAWVKEYCLFKDKSVISDNVEYQRFLRQLCSYTHEGKNKHDDAPDACAMLAEYVHSFARPKVQVFRRFF